MIKELIKGFRFGLLLQFAVGPICLFLIQAALIHGSNIAMSGVIAVVIVDACYIIFAILGLGALINKPSMKKWLKLFGGIVLILFGLDMILSCYNISLIPTIGGAFEGKSKNVFMQTLFMTLSNPLTILFWTGVFTTRINEENKNSLKLYVFGGGAVLSTFMFLSMMVLVSGMISVYINDIVMRILNVIVGIIIAVFGVKLLTKKVEAMKLFLK